MITIICGKPRAGKTALMTRFALQHLYGFEAKQDLKQCNNVIESLNAGGFKITPPDKHLVFADYPIFTRRCSVVSNYCNGFYLGLPNKQKHPVMFLPPYSHIYLDEAQKYYNSRESKNLADFVSRYFELHGHFHLNITLAVQRPMLIDLNIRELAAEVIYVEALTHNLDHGIIVGSTWHCIKFNDVSAAIAYIEGKGGKGEKVQYTYDSNIFHNYDSFFFKSVFLREMYRRDLDIKPALAFPSTVDGIAAFNKKYDYMVPKTFFKKKEAKTFA